MPVLKKQKKIQKSGRALMFFHFHLLCSAGGVFQNEDFPKKLDFSVRH